jgi:hypothetical protein
VGSESENGMPALTVVESVRCLECGVVYVKPAGGGTVRENPGCPDCGYVGWMAAELIGALEAATSQRRRAAGRQPNQNG